MHKDIIKRTYKYALKFLCKYLGLSIKPNAIYSKKDIIKPVIRASVENTTIESSTRRLNNISADNVFYHLDKLSYKHTKQCLDKGIEDSLVKAKKKYRLAGKVTIAIDITDIPYYGKYNGAWVHSTKRNKVIKVMSVHIVEKGYRFTIAVIPLDIFYRKARLVAELINTAMQHINIHCVLLDRGFLSVDVTNILQEIGIRFAIPIIKNDKAVRIMEQCYINGIDRIRYTMESNNRQSTFDLVIHELDDDIVGFATNMEGLPERIAGLYKARWGIETGYRMKNVFYGRTCSRSFSIRFLLVLLSFMLYNLWALVNKILEFRGLRSVTADDMCIFIVEIMTSNVT